jgi:endonuclease/exonuclease/phosphatase family metal-dependent hydrolase
VLNEVDFDASWSRGINQARVLAERAGYPCWVEQRNLDFRVLFWKWRFGNAVLSRHPITSASAIDLPGYSRTETLLAGSKRGVLCEIEVNGKPVQIAGVHLCHRSEEIRTQSAERLVALAAKFAIPFFVVGDLNSTPPEFREGQADPPVRNAIQMLDRSSRFNRMPTNRPTTAEMTFHSRTPTSVIDWIMIPRGWEFHDYRAVPSSLSDHRLVQAGAAPAARALNSDLR